MDKRDHSGDYSDVRNVDAQHANKEHYAAQLYQSHGVQLL